MKINRLILSLSLPYMLFATTIDFDEALNKTIANNKSLKAKKLSVENAKLDLKKADGYNYGNLTFEENIARTNNALNTFGMKLMSREATFRDFGFSDFLGGVGQVLNNSADFNAFKAQMTNPAMAEQLLNTAPDDLNNPEARTNYETKVVYEAPLFTGFKLQNAKTMAKLQIKAKEAKYNYDEKQLGLEVLKAYNGAVAAKYFIKATQKAKKATTSFVTFASEMFKEGFVTNIDVQQAQVYDMKINSMLLEANSKYKLAIAYLKFLTNDSDITDVNDFKSLNVEVTDLNTLQNQAIQNRDDLNWMKQNTETMKTKVKFEKSANYPMIGAHLEYGYNDDQLNNIDSKHDYYTAAVGLQYKIFSGFATSSNIQKAKLDYAKTKHYLDYMTDGIKLQVEKAYLTLKTKQSVLKQKLKAQSLADEVLEKSEQMYKNNLMKMSDLLMQQASAQQARAEAILAHYEATIAAAKLKLALGQNLKGEK